MITLLGNPSTSTTSSTTPTYTILSLVLNYVELIFKFVFTWTILISLYQFN